MGRTISSVRITNVKDPSKHIRCDAMVDAGASPMVLPEAWKERSGELDSIHVMELETATQSAVMGEVCGPVQIQLEGFRPIYNETV